MREVGINGWRESRRRPAQRTARSTPKQAMSASAAAIRPHQPAHLSGATMITVSPLYCVSSSDSSWRTRTSTSALLSCTVPSTLGAGRLQGGATSVDCMAVEAVQRR